MLRSAIVTTAVVAVLLAPSGAPTATAAAFAQAAQATPASAAAFIGEWTLNLQGPNGPAAFDLTVKSESEKVAAEITVPSMPAQPITDVTRAGESLVLSYSFNYEGNPVGAVVKLTPAAEGKVNAEVSFADGAYVMNGTAVKKEKAK